MSVGEHQELWSENLECETPTAAMGVSSSQKHECGDGRKVRATDLYWKTTSYHWKALLFIVNYLVLYPKSQGRDLYIFSLDK